MNGRPHRAWRRSVVQSAATVLVLAVAGARAAAAADAGPTQGLPRDESGSSSGAPGAAALRNWFDDPFLVVRDRLPGCPVPLGPLQTEAEMKRESHYRSERGARCWLEGKCREPNSYRYDAGIAAAVGERFAKSRDFAAASLWVTVKRRWVFVEGCVASAGDRKRLERFVGRVPDVEAVVVDVMVGTRGKTPYRALPPS